MTDHEKFRQQVRRMYSDVEKTPYLKQFPFKIVEIDEGLVRLAFFVESHFCNYRGIASGGILAAFCDTLMGMPSRTLGYQVTTLEINMNYIRRVAAGHTITGVGRVVHHGCRTLVTECECLDEEGRVVVKGRASFYVLGLLSDDNN